MNNKFIFNLLCDNKVYHRIIDYPLATNLPTRQNRTLDTTSGSERIKAAGSSPATKKNRVATARAE